jgi:SWI/SNF-related matrix-associated actin-dependent regulator of chromatin subfamily A3
MDVLLLSSLFYLTIATGGKLKWIEEARSKLSNPGIVYSYHGSGRKRDAKTLSSNAVVVTTYETLASDATYHAKKRGPN